MTVNNFIRDAQYGWRALRRSPTFTIVTIGTLAIGIGAVTTLFSFVNAVYFRPLPFPDAHRLRAIGEQRPNGFWSWSVVYAPAARELLQPSMSFERVSAYATAQQVVAVRDRPPQMLTILAIDTAFTAMLRLRAAVGRLPSREETLGDASVAVISHSLWQAHFGGDSSILGRSLHVGARQYSVIGVMQERFRFPWQTDVWVPRAQPVPNVGDDVAIIAKLRDAVTPQAAQAELNVIATRVESAEPVTYRNARLVLRDEILDRRARGFMPMPSMFLGATFLLLFVACSNVANLFHSRAAERRGELALRGALGASRRRLVRQVLTESLLVGSIGAAIGTLLSVWFVRLCLSVIPTQGFPAWIEFTLDVRVLAFSVGVALLVTLLVGLTPALDGTRFDLARALKVGGDGGSHSSGVRAAAQRALAIQVSLAVVLFVGAAMMVQSYRRMMSVDLGYPAEQIAQVVAFYDRARYTTMESQMRLIEGVLPRIAALPGVTHAAARGLGSRYPRDPMVHADTTRGVWVRPDTRLFLDGDTVNPVEIRPLPRTFVVSDDYFRMLGLRVEKGRSLSAVDVWGSTPATVVSRQLAHMLAKDGNAVGHRLQLGAMSRSFEIVGVVEDVNDIVGGRDRISADPRPDVYFSARQMRAAQYQLLARTDGDATLLHSAMVEQLRAAEPNIRVAERERTMASQVEMQLLVTRVFGGLIGTLSAIAILLVTIGVYGVVSYAVTQRTREIGVRIALGGTAAAIVGMIMRDGLRFVLVGVAAGLCFAAIATRLLTRFLFGVTPLDPTAYIVAALVFSAIALLACWIPARRAARVDALVALRAG